MRDQAENLRLKMLESQGALAKSIAVVSGKGGVGKSNFSTNFAYALISQGKKVVIVDMDIGMGNIHILLGDTPRYSLMDYLDDSQDVDAVINKTEDGLDFISGGSGLEKIMEWSEATFDRLTSVFEYLQKKYDFVLFDMGAGATEQAIDLIMAVDKVIVISTMEPTSITDAYSMMKFIVMRDPNVSLYLVSNRIPKKQNGDESVLRLQFAMRKFLNKETTVLGYLPEDSVVQKAVIEQKPYFLAYPRAAVSKNLLAMTEMFTTIQSEEKIQEESSFIKKLKNIFWRGRE